MDLSVGESGSTLLIGPTLSGRRRLFHRLLWESPGRPAVVETRNTAECLRSRYQRVAHDDASPPIVVDCITNSLGRSEDDTKTTKYAQDPGNLTSIGMKFADILDQHETDQLSVGLTNLSPLIVYTSTSDVSQFAHILIQKSIGTDWPVVATIDPRVHNASTVEQFVPLFDSVIETRRTDDGDQAYRIQKPERTDWETF
ncbi:hypothetical protein [Halorubrum sp. GN11GM_10-3_MGM]|uniref:DUF7504 family protein n=1 Tax=Halorubrum sp. GN11GM_10-3_MGM TaxID=2518111 RepID=UPI0010F4A239|nr:hypothetical protein [Halorubrum sp. GN11GM_10-3_MGM]TKX66962.1 hypothetical protein EXE40_15505 [Halorubrum sp. GN11GM_10-3_MGM]